jgi:hypothetical protein
VTSIPLDSLTLATFLKAELGFLGVIVLTCKQTPLLKGLLVLVYFFFKGLKFVDKAKWDTFCFFAFLGFLTNWFIVGMVGII